MLRAVVDHSPPPQTVGELVARWLSHCRATYPPRIGRRSSTFTNARDATRPLLEVCGDLLLTELSAPLARCVQQWMIECDLARRTINDRIARIRRMMRWAIGQGWVPESTLEALTIDPLRKGRTTAREAPRKRAVPVESIVRVLRDPLLAPTVKDMIRFQLRTGMRPAEVCDLRGDEIDTSDSTWVYQPPEHKMAWLERERVVLIGPRAQLILLPYLRDGFVFLSRLGKPYRVDSYRQSIDRACLRTGTPRWCPQQIRKRTGTEAAKVSVKAAQDVLGHSDERTTRKHYIDTRHSPDAQEFVEAFG